MRISDWSSDVCSSDLAVGSDVVPVQRRRQVVAGDFDIGMTNVRPVPTERGLMPGNAIARRIQRRFLAGEQQHAAGYRVDIGVGRQRELTRALEPRVPVAVEHRVHIEPLMTRRIDERIDPLLELLGALDRKSGVWGKSMSVSVD